MGRYARERTFLKKSLLPRAPFRKDYGGEILGGEAASLREAPLPPDPSLPKSGWRLSCAFLLAWFRLSVESTLR